MSEGYTLKGRVKRHTEMETTEQTPSLEKMTENVRWRVHFKHQKILMSFLPDRLVIPSLVLDSSLG